MIQLCCCLSQHSQLCVCVINMLPLFLIPGLVKNHLIFFFFNLAEKLIAKCGRKRNNGSSREFINKSLSL